ncbi:hypothetical protein [Enterococcus wangshanyuanii]|uniref:Uncharacterized protein n=1 Tax=Enterococcus wangshanyuanii TaxID=2005703 RepID=A0ABQ1P2N6_9ENTE|nr:hypothetical protein [Enterococcus wangshanyuanii]GGC89798.1 hypothetical protein GCM10011573_19320 [Enterococcus wangshanyuanii]
MAEILTDDILDEAGMKELRKARQKNNIRSFVGTAALLEHTSREQGYIHKRIEKLFREFIK